MQLHDFQRQLHGLRRSLQGEPESESSQECALLLSENEALNKIINEKTALEESLTERAEQAERQVKKMQGRATAAEEAMDRTLRELVELRISHENLETTLTRERESRKQEIAAGEARRGEDEHIRHTKSMEVKLKRASQAEAEALEKASERSLELEKCQEALCELEQDLIAEQKARSKSTAMLAMVEADLEKEKAEHAELKRRHVLVNRYLKI